MVSTYVAAALLLSATLLGLAEGERKLTRPLPTVSETKERERANFDCPEEFGYYPHPTDCTQYYVCVFGGALLESCTGGLMYSQELQTCDWPRNVGCDGLEISASPQSSAPCTNCGSQSIRSRERERPREREREETRGESRTKYSPPPPPPPPQPKAVVTSRGQPRQLQSQQDIIKQQLYADVEEALPPAEEIESDRQQRVYRGQPSTVGQVQRDRDGYRHSNAIPTYKDRGEKIGVISFGTQSQLQHYSTAPDLDEIMTNDLTAKKRRKRNAQRSRAPYSDPTSWIGVQGNRHIHHNRPFLEFSRQKPNVVGYNIQEEFQPFVPKYALASNQAPVKYFPPNSFQYFNPNTHSRPISSGTAHNYVYAKINNNPAVQSKYRGAPIRHTVEYNYNSQPPNTLEAAYSNIVSQAIAVEPKRIRNGNTNNNTRTHTDALTKGFVEQDKAVQQSYKEQTPTVTNGYLEPARAETKKEATSDRDRGNKIKENHEEGRLNNNEQKRPVSYYTKERPKIYKEERIKNFEEEDERNNQEEQPKSYKEESQNVYEEEPRLKNHKEETPIIFNSERQKKLKTDRQSHNNGDSKTNYENEDQNTKQSAAHAERSEESPEKDTDSKGDSDSDEAKETDSKDDEVDDDKPKNSTTSYEYHSTEVDEDELGPPPEFYNDKNKYEHIQNPFEDPNFDFDSFLARLGSTTSTTTTSTTTKTTTTTQKPKPKPKRVQQVRQEAIPTKETQFEKYDPLPGGLIPANNYATPAPDAHTKPVKEDLSEDYLDSANRKQLYSSQIKTGNNKTLPKSDEYEYYYEEYDYPEPSSSNSKLSKVPNTNTTEVKYSAKYQKKQDKPLIDILSEATKDLPSYNISSHLEQYLTETVDTPIIKDGNNSTILNSIPTPVANSTEHFDNIFGPGQFLIETSVITTTTPKSKNTLTSDRKRNTVRTTSKPLKQKLRPTNTELDVPDSKQEQSNIITSEDKSTPAQAPTVSTATATARTLYNSSQYNNINQNDNRYDPYYALYDEDVELYKDVDYTAQNNNYNTNTQGTRGSTSNVYRGSPAVVREESSKRGNAVYNNVNQDIYQQPSTVSDYTDNSYQVEDTAYRQSSRAPSRGDRNEINEVEEIPTTKRTTSTTRKLTTTTPRITTMTQARTLPPKKITTTSSSQAPVTATENQTQALSNNTNPGHIVDAPKSSTIPIKSRTQNLLRPVIVDKTPDYTLHEPYAVVKKPTPFLLAQHLTTVKPAFHFITKAPRSTHQISSSTINEDSGMSKTTLSNNVDVDAQSSIKLKVIVPTTYSPPKYLLRSILPKNSVFSSPEFSFRPKNQTRVLNNNKQSYQYKTLKAVRKLINPITVNHELSTSSGATYESAEDIVNNYDANKSEELNNVSNDKTDEIQFLDVQISPNYTKKPSKITTTTTTTNPKTINSSTTTKYVIMPTKLTSTTELTNFDDERLKSSLYALLSKEKFGKYIKDDRSNTTSSKKRFKITVEVPPPRQILDEDTEKPEPDQLPSYRPNPITFPIVEAKADFPVNTSNPPRVSRVNAAIKSLIAIAGTKGPTKCSEKGPKCKVEAKERTPSRGRGSSHYTNSASITSNEVTVNRGTPAPRSRPTLKPSTSIVSKATEFVDIYKYPPRRPGALYPQPQPDKTAAKCRKDVCLLPDCSCGGKEIPGDILVEETPQIVLMTFDDAVNDLNKQYYTEIFENGRKNPNGCPISASFYVSHEWTDYSQVQNLYADGHELASHTVSHSFGEQFSQKKWTREVAGQREILAAYGGVKLEDVRGMRAPFLSVGGNKMFKMLYDSNFTYDSSMPIYENKPPSWPYTLDYKLFHDCMIPPCPTRSYPGVWEVPMVMWQDLNGGRCSMGDACSNPPDADGVFKMLLKNFERHYTTNRAPFGLFYHAAWFTQPHHKEGFINFIDTILAMKDVWLLTNWQALQWVRDPTPTSRLNNFQPFQCDYADRPKRCNNPKVCNLWHKSGVRYMRTCQPCPDIYPWTGNSGIRSSRVDNDIEDSK